MYSVSSRLIAVFIYLPIEPQTGHMLFNSLNRRLKFFTFIIFAPWRIRLHFWPTDVSVEAILIVWTSAWDNRALWPNGWMDRADFWHRPSSPQTPSCIRWGPPPLFGGGGIGGPKVFGSMGRYRKISSYRHEILYSDYPWPKKHACQISAQSPKKVWGYVTTLQSTSQQQHELVN